jgi:transposase
MVRAWRVERNGFGRKRRSGRSVSRRTAPGVSVAQVARRHAVNANMVFKWLRDPRYAPEASAPTEGPTTFLAVEIVDHRRNTVLPPAPEPAPATGMIEIDLAGGQRMRVSGRYDPEALARLIRGLTA